MSSSRGRSRGLGIGLFLLLLTTGALADDVSEAEARRFFKQGNEQFERGEFDPALQRFRMAYALWKNPKILINIGTTLSHLGRNAEATEAYQQYIADPRADPGRIREIETALAAVDAKTAKLELSAGAPGVTVNIDGRTYDAAKHELVRVDPGVRTLIVLQPTGEQRTEKVSLAAGQIYRLVLSAAASHDDAARAPVLARRSPRAAQVGRRGRTERESHGGMLGAFARADADVREGSAIVALGASYGLGDRFAVALAALLASDPGFEPAILALLLDGAYKPVIVAGVPVFVAEGARVGVRGGGGFAWDPSQNLGFFLHVTPAYFFDAPAGYRRSALIASLGGELRF